MPKKCMVRYHSHEPDPPKGGGSIGSTVRFHSCEAAIHTATDDGEPEVTSALT